MQRAPLRSFVRRFPTMIRALASRALGVQAPTLPGPTPAPVPPAEPMTVDGYWNQHTVNSTPFTSAAESLAYLDWRFGEYPLFREFMELYGQHDGETIMDYGCGPGNDLVGFLAHTQARKVIGVDVSAKALGLARQRLGLHAFAPSRFDLVPVTDASPAIPLADESIDYIYCEGVLHHTSDVSARLAEFFRVLRRGGKACIMVYNRDSIWLHLYTAYLKQVIEGAFAGLDIEQAFTRNTDGEACPIAHCYTGQAFQHLCGQAGFTSEYVGGYFSRWELTCLREHGPQAQADPRLAEAHRSFLRALVTDANGYPTYAGKHAGIGGVYRLMKAA